VRPADRRHLDSARGWILAETLAAIGMIVLIFAMAAVALQQFSLAQRESDIRRELRLAVETELNCIRAGFSSSAERADCALSAPNPTVQLRSTVAPGDGEWSGFNLVTITASKLLHARREISVRLSSYVPISGETR
jgi:hypothetical protein